MYSINCITKWGKNWKKNNWITAGKKPVKNQELIKTIRDRKYNPKENSYTNKLLADKKLSLDKVKEEIQELIESIEKDTNKIHEGADVIYHLLVYLEANEIKIEDIIEELKKRKK